MDQNLSAVIMRLLDNADGLPGFRPSPAVLNYLSLRMDAQHGVPTVWEKAKADLDALLGKVSPTDQAVIAGEMRDLHATVDFLNSIFGSVLQNVEQGALQIATNAAKGILAAIPNVTSLQQAVDILTAAFEAESGPLADFLKSIGQQAFATLVSAILTGLGKVVPVSPRA